jgi:branched-chain amino acid transport system substrate-binding protein
MFKKKLLASVSILAMTSALVSQPASAQISNDKVRIGVLTDMSGQFSHESGAGSVTAVRMAIEDFGGKVNGKPIELIYADHQNKPDIGASKAREWYDNGIDMIAGLINSGVALSVTNVAKEKNKIAGRAKKEYINKQETLAKKSETLYSLNDDDIDDIYDILDETMPD